MPYRISLELKPKEDELAILKTGMMEDAKNKAGDDAGERFAFFIRDDANKIVGGVDGEIWCGCLHINHLWVDEPIRGEGYGQKLMLSAENFGSERGCTFSAANTMILEVVSFYKKLGYIVEFERLGYLKSSILYFLRRDLAPAISKIK